MKVLRIHGDVQAAMLAHARGQAPRECCGLLIGASDLIDECVPADNIDPDPARRYLLDPAAHIATRRRLRGGTGRDIIGVYHSHPASPARPSPTDLAEARYPELVWVIVSLAGGAAEMAAYQIGDGAAVPVGLVPVGGSNSVTRIW